MGSFFRGSFRKAAFKPSPHVLLVTIITIVTLCLDFTGPSDGRISTEAPPLIIAVFIFGCDDE